MGVAPSAWGEGSHDVRRKWSGKVRSERFQAFAKKGGISAGIKNAAEKSGAADRSAPVRSRP